MNRENPLSLVNLYPEPRFMASLQNLKEKYPDLVGMPEKELKKEIRRITSQIVGPDDSMLRMKFWMEYDTAMREGRRMHTSRICGGVMGDSYFWVYLSKPTNLAWILCPLSSYEQQLDEALGTGMKRLREILELPIEDPNTGKIDTKLIAAQMRIIAMLDMRKNGAFTQKIEQKNMNYHASSKDVAKEIQNLTMEEVEKRMKKLDYAEKDTANILKKASKPTYTIEALEVETGD